MQHSLPHSFQTHGPLVLVIGGALLLLLGRKLFWLSVAVIGFVVGAELAVRYLPNQSEIVRLVVEIGIGLIGALLAIFMQELAIGIAGFLLGGELGILLGRALAFYRPEYWWLFFLVAGIIGAILMVSFFDWGLIILSSLAGARLIMDAVPHIHYAERAAGFAVLAVLGIAVQASLLRRRRVVVRE
jgi:hypothetical protein